MSARILIHPTSGIWLVSPRVDPQILGLLPDFLDVNDPRPARAQIIERYGFGWNQIMGAEFSMEDGSLKFPGDPNLQPYAICCFCNELVVAFPFDIVVIVQDDDTWEAARLN